MISVSSEQTPSWQSQFSNVLLLPVLPAGWWPPRPRLRDKPRGWVLAAAELARVAVSEKQRQQLAWAGEWTPCCLLSEREVRVH